MTRHTVVNAIDEAEKFALTQKQSAFIDELHPSLRAEALEYLRESYQRDVDRSTESLARLRSEEQARLQRHQSDVQASVNLLLRDRSAT